MNFAGLSAISLLLYSCASLADYYRVVRGRQVPKATFAVLLSCALSLHLVASTGMIAKDMGVWHLSLANTLSLSAWMIAALAAWLRARQQVGILLAPVFLSAGVLCLLGALSPQDGRQIGSSLGLAVHISLSLAAYATLFIAGGQALLTGWQNRALKSRQLGNLKALPPLVTMERLLFDLLLAGWSLLTVGLITGVIFVDNLLGQNLAHKTVLSGLAWILFGTLLAGRRLAGWRASTATAWTLGGLAVLSLGTLGSKFILEFVLGRA